MSFQVVNCMEIYAQRFNKNSYTKDQQQFH